MATQQVVAPPAKAAMFLTLTVPDGAQAAVRDWLTGVSGYTRSVSYREPEAGLICVVGVGAHLWDRLYDAPRPRGLHPFEELTGERHTAPATPGDLLIHLRAARLDLCFALAKLLTDRLGDHAEVIDEVHGFAFFDDRDLLGFVDGTENPEGGKAAAAVTIGEEDPAYAGGSYVIVQKYVHDLRAWEALSVEEQENAIGRSKLEDIEMPDADKPANSHVRLTTVEDENGVQRQIVRDNMPFGRVGDAEYGTYFIGYAKDPDVIETMLRRMFVGDPVGTTDRILDFSTATTGALFFVPSPDLLDDGPAGVTGANADGGSPVAPEAPASPR